MGLGNHPDAAAMGTTLQREIRSNSRDSLLDNSNNGAVDIDVSSGGTITPTDDEGLASGLIRFTGSPGTDPIFNFVETAKQITLFNDSTRDIDTTASSGELLLEGGVDSLLLEDGSGVVLLEAPTTLVPAAETRLFQKDGSVFRTLGLVGLQAGAFLSSGQVPATGAINFADFQLSRVVFKDYSFTVTSPSSTAGTLVLDMENGNAFDVTLTENVTTLTLSNPPSNVFALQLEDGSGNLQLEDGSGDLLKETPDQAGTIIFIARQDAGGGNVITWPASVLWEQASGGSPDQTTSGNGVDVYMLLTVSGGATWYGFVLGLNMG